MCELPAIPRRSTHRFLPDTDAAACHVTRGGPTFTHAELAPRTEGAYVRPRGRMLRLPHGRESDRLTHRRSAMSSQENLVLYAATYADGDSARADFF